MVSSGHARCHQAQIRGNVEQLATVRQERLRWLVPAILMFLIVVFAFSREALALFRPEFAEAGVMPLRLLAVSTAFTVLFSLAPTYLKFQKRNRAIYGVVISSAAAQILLLLLLVPSFGATGAAAAYAASMCGMYGVFAAMAHREVMALKQAAAGRRQATSH